MTDAQWALLAPLLPPAASTVGRGRPEEHPRRLILDAMFYLIAEGVRWRSLPWGFPPWQTVYGFFTRWRADGTWQRIHDALREQVRTRAGRASLPTAAVIDSQSLKAAETVAAGSRGFDAGKKINGRKRHIAVDTLGLLLAVTVTAASVQDRDGAYRLLSLVAERFSTVRLVWADGGYAGKLLTWAAKVTRIEITILKRNDDVKASSSYPAGGSWNAPWAGSPATAAWSATTNDYPPTTRP